MSTPISRRDAFRQAALGTTALASMALLQPGMSAAEQASGKLKGRVHHSVCKWCYGKIPLEDFAKAAKDMGIQSVELLQPKDIPTIRKYDLTCAMVSNPTTTAGDVKVGGIEKAFNRIEYHDALFTAYEQQIKDTAAAGLTNLICFSGNRAGMSDEQGLKNCAIGLKRLMPIAEKHKVVLVMELLNSKVNHKDYMCDLSKWGVALCKEIGSENFKLLYDIYHMQIMEGDVITTIKKDHQYFAHYHTGGVPGRAEIDESQELYYPAIMKAIMETGFKGFVAQEFIPKRPDVLASLKQGVQICDV